MPKKPVRSIKRISRSREVELARKARELKAKAAPKSKRKDHPVGIRLSDSELDMVKVDCDEITATTGFEIKVGSYAKHAVVSHRRLRRFEARVRDLVSRPIETMDLLVEIAALKGALDDR
jgi:methylthioribose-1-phosphate isomerase